MGVCDMEWIALRCVWRFRRQKMGAGLDFRGCVCAIEAKGGGTECMMDAAAAVALFNVWQSPLPYYDPESSIITFCTASSKVSFQSVPVAEKAFVGGNDEKADAVRLTVGSYSLPLKWSV